MKQTATRIFRAAISTASAAICVLAGVASADESEIFVGTGNAVSNQRPNILFVIDTSAQCPQCRDRCPTIRDGVSGYLQQQPVYFRSGSNSSAPPACNNNTSLPVVASCAMPRREHGAQWLLRGGSRGTVARRRSPLARHHWQHGNAVWVECRADAGIHGNGVNLRVVAADAANGPWSSNSAQAIGWNANGANSGYVFYSANYINLADQSPARSPDALQIVQQLRSKRSTTRDRRCVNVGLMQFSTNTHSGCT